MRRDFCYGCAADPQRVNNLPSDWVKGDPIPANTTLHRTENDPRLFSFRGHPDRQDRVYYDD